MTCSDYVMFRGGLALPLAPVRLAWDLEKRGVHLALDSDRLAVGPRTLLTDEDRVHIGRWRQHLIALVNYEPPAVAGVDDVARESS